MTDLSHLIRPEDLDRHLDRIRAAALDDRAGLFGPASLLWRVDREAALFLGAGRALLLQLAHPWIATGIAQHSATLADPIGRFHRTFAIMFTLVFGSREGSLAAARRLYRRHGSVRGTLPETIGPFAKGSAYTAQDAAASLWVHATLVETALIAHDLVLPPLTEEERERYYQESRVLGSLFGLGPEAQPATWREFAAYSEGMIRSDILTVGPEARQIAGAVLAGAGSWLSAPGWYRALTASLLPEPLLAAYDLPFGEGERGQAERARRWLRRAYPLLPTRLRHVGPYQEALGRIEGRDSPDLPTRWLNRAWIGRPAMARRG